MPQSLYDLLNACTVRITSKVGQGTGFFVAPGTVLTCKHVIENALKPAAPIEISWQGQTFPASLYAAANTNNLDLALLRANIPQHLCVLLHGGAEPFSKLYSYGYADIKPQGASNTFDSEGWVGTQQELLRLKDGQARPGMSGSPVLNSVTGCICGIVQSTRDRASSLGGEAIMTKVILREFPELAEKQRLFHSQDKRWYDAMTVEQRKESGIKDILSLKDTSGAVEVFYSYVQEDEQLAEKLRRHLVLLKRQELITDWYAGKVVPGQEPSEQIREHLDSASIILLLISSDYLFSEYHDSVEVKRAMERSKAGEAIVMPILLSTTDDLRNTPFGRLQVFPRNRKPINKWSDKDEALAEIAKEIRAVVERLRSPNPR
ncbi:MAG: trypsin-like peptidase domain-containing protein [Ktedonobacteraceae bacterium]